MKLKELSYNLSKLTRSSDWRLSFIPFIIGSVYLWLVLLEVQFSPLNLAFVFLSILTAMGFAALGYFINEFFDKKQDKEAGKINKLSLLSGPKQTLLFLSIVLLTFLPWVLLPKDNISYILIGLELSLFILYSFPGLRLKSVSLVAGVIDASYAYLVPGLLAYHTFVLIKGATETSSEPAFFFLAIFFIGYRNIFTHQLKDVLHDIRSKTPSLPQILGSRNSSLFLRILITFELVFLLFFSIELLYLNLWFVAWLFLVLIYFALSYSQIKHLINSKNWVKNLSKIDFLNTLYQLWFPLFALVILLFIDWKWLILIPIHLSLLIKRKYLEDLWADAKYLLWHKSTKPVLSVLINYPIYFMFRIFGINLEKENKSAWGYLKDKF